MDAKQNIEYLVSEFISKTGANRDDALTCLKTWGWDMKRALTDYNDTCAHELIDDEDDNNSKEQQKSSAVIVTTKPTSTIINHKEIKSAPALIKQESIDMIDCKKLFRGISRATDNASIVSRARSEIAMDFYKNINKKSMENTNFQYSVDTPDSTFILPNIYNYPDDFRIFIEKDLIETSTLNALEQAQRLNWWVDTNACRKLWPLATTGDGNCLLHAASLGMWGFHDRKLTLRTALYSVLSDGKFKDALYRRWRFQQTQFNKRAGFVYSESEWSKEWDDIITMASPEPRRSNNHNSNSSNIIDNSVKRRGIFERDCYGDSEVLDNNISSLGTTTTTSTSAAVYESLEEIHILALAHVLRRTIIVISDTVLRDLHGEAMAPITFGGIYLPLEIEPKECNRGPLVLAYDMAHFSALVPMENESDFPPVLVPLTDYENVLLPIQFCIDPGENFDWKLYNGNEENWTLTEREHIALLKEYLDIVYVATNRSPDDDLCEDLDEDFEKKFTESEIIIPTTADYFANDNDVNHINNNTNGNTNNKSKASKQLHIVAKQFGSIGKNMSRKLKKNIGSIAKLGSSSSSNSSGSGGGKSSLHKKNSFTTISGNVGGNNSTSSHLPYVTCSRILCARLRLKRYEYQEEMIRNYIECAQNRFIEVERSKEKAALTGLTGTIIKDDCVVDGIDKISNNSIIETGSICINAGCNEYATSKTSYLCPYCFEKQKEQENLQFFNSSPRYGTGNSKFYTQADFRSHDSIRKLPSLRKLNDLDQTLYLSNSTFYNDVLPSYNEVERFNKESQRHHNTQHNITSHHSPSSSSSASSSTYGGGGGSGGGGGGINSGDNGSGNNTTTISSPSSLSSPSSAKTVTGNTTIINIGGDQQGIGEEYQYLIDRDNDGDNIKTTSVTKIIPITRQCKTLGCPFYGNSSTNFLCSKCQKYAKSPQQQQKQSDLDYNIHHHHHHHHNNNLSSSSTSSGSSLYQTSPLYSAPSTGGTSVALYKSESKITSDI